MIPAISGVFCAAATPLNEDLSPDLGMFATHCRALLDDGCDGIALLGTTGEANSFSSGERREILEAALSAGIDPGRLLPGTGLANIPETVDLTRHALSCGVTTVVMLPPFYYKGVSDDGLFDAYARVIDGIGDTRLRVILYHIPQMTGLPIGHDLIGRLIAAFPGTVIGIKDSAGKIENMEAMVTRFPGFAVLAGADPLLLPLMRMGGAGCITATSNLVGRELAYVFRNATDDAKGAGVAAVQARINAYRDLSNSYVQIPAIKAMIGRRHGHDGWARTRPPLVPTTASERADLARRLDDIDTHSPGAPE
jgi:4-hydroxy-tetrahydrodipicolinate synthase